MTINTSIFGTVRKNEKKYTNKQNALCDSERVECKLSTVCLLPANKPPKRRIPSKCLMNKRFKAQSHKQCFKLSFCGCCCCFVPCEILLFEVFIKTDSAKNESVTVLAPTPCS